MCLVVVVVRRYIHFLILLIPTPLVYICSFWQQHPYFFVHFCKCFSFLFLSFFFAIYVIFCAV